jgi:hypothetical protein
MFMRSESALGILGRGPGLTLSDQHRTAGARTLPPICAHPELGLVKKKAVQIW